MSRLFGDIRQLGYVVHDIEAATDHWTRTLGIGPWFYAPKVPVEDSFYRGRSVMDAEVGANGHCCYFDTESHPGTVVELPQVAGPKGRMFDMIREASKYWDGKDPVWPFPDLRTL